MNSSSQVGPLIDKLVVSCYTVPTDGPESDGTLAWEKTTLVLVEAMAGGQTSLGYSYADVTTGKLVESLLAEVVMGANAFDISGMHASMVHTVRNLGQPGIAAMAISAVDNALWDLKAKLLGVSMLDLLGAVRERAMIYGSGGFTSYSIEELQEQLGAWAAEGMKMVKMKIGRNPAADVERVRAARKAIGPEVELFVDANGVACSDSVFMCGALLANPGDGACRGYRFVTMPADGEAYRLGFQAIEQIARRSYGRPFQDLPWLAQEELLKSIHDAKPKEGAEEIWEKMPVRRYWALLVQDCVESYYAHPWAWDEIGFFGPAYPRAYMRLEHGDRSRWSALR